MSTHNPMYWKYTTERYLGDYNELTAMNNTESGPNKLDQIENWMNKLRSEVPQLTPWEIIKNKTQADTPLWYLSNTNYAEHYTEHPYSGYTIRALIWEGGVVTERPSNYKAVLFRTINQDTTLKNTLP